MFRTFIRKNTVLLTTAFAGAFAFELCVTFGPPVLYTKLTMLFSISAFDIGSNKIWDTWNQGVCDLPFRHLAGPWDLQALEPTLTLSRSANGRISSTVTWLRRKRMTSELFDICVE